VKYAEETISAKELYKGNIIDLNLVRVKLPNGKESTREIVIHPGASVVIPIAQNGDLYMVRQFRKPLEREMLELPAGKLDKGESPEACALRELNEETGLEAGWIKHVISVHSTPGFCNEVLHLFAAGELKEGTAHSDEDEFVSCERVALNDLLNMIFKGEITDAKTIIGIFIADRIIRGEIEF
jgi:ADP-ribose pyrophosphatase